MIKNRDFNKNFQTSKPLMEKRRRERINRSLNDLKSILLEALRRDVSKIFALKLYIFEKNNIKMVTLLFLLRDLDKARAYLGLFGLDCVLSI